MQFIEEPTDNTPNFSEMHTQELRKVYTEIEKLQTHWDRKGQFFHPEHFYNDLLRRGIQNTNDYDVSAQLSDLKSLQERFDWFKPTKTRQGISFIHRFQGNLSDLHNILDNEDISPEEVSQRYKARMAAEESYIQQKLKEINEKASVTIIRREMSRRQMLER